MSINALLKQHLKPLEKYFKKKEIVEICINEPGRVWIETMDGWKQKKDDEITIRAMEHLAEILATNKGQKFDAETNPILSTAIPDYGYRIQVVGGALSDSGISISIRIAQARRFPVEDYLEKETAEKLKEAITTGKTILVAGGTSSGKTTLLNSMIRYIPDETRLIVIEDTKELVVDQPNTVRLLKSKSGTDIAQITYKDIINSCMRMRPDRILMGEIDIENTAPFLRLINAGHAGSMATVHADSPDQAIDALVLNAQLAGLQGGKDLVEDYTKKSIDLVVHIKRKSRKEFEATVKNIKFGT